MSARRVDSALQEATRDVETEMKLIPKLLIVLGFVSLGGCVVAPVGPPRGVYVGPEVVVGAPYVAVSPYYYGYGPHYYYGRRW